MGSSQSKDPNISIHLSLAKRLHYAGETVEGMVHLYCTSPRPYTVLYIKLHGKEKVHWTEDESNDDGTTTHHYRNKRQTYGQEFVLAKFNTGVKVGQYSFPFSLLLPSAFPASFSYSQDNYIHYFISAYMPPFDANSSIQMFEQPLHIREPCRLLQKTFFIRDISEAQCCGCCVGGAVELTLESDTVNLFQNQMFRVRGLVNNTGGETDVIGSKIVLREQIRRISESGKVVDTNKEFVLRSFPNSVPIGTSFPFEAEVIIPTTVLGFTAIGNIICRVYFLELVAKVNFYSDPKISRHVILNNNIQPQIQESKERGAPVGWNPRIEKPISFLNLKPYYYSPMIGIKDTNQVRASNQMRPNAINPSQQRIVY